jgi:DNA repair exonuclease SbcCD ATPase subunit
MRNSAAEKRRKELAEAPTVKTKEQVEAEEAKAKAKAEEAAKHGTHPKTITYEADTSIWKRKFRPLPEAKAVDLFADVIGDAFILTVAVSLLMYEYIKARSKPDANAERIKELAEQLEAEQQKIAELEDAEKQRQARLEVLEKSLEEMRRGPVEKIKRAMTHS